MPTIAAAPRRLMAATSLRQIGRIVAPRPPSLALVLPRAAQMAHEEALEVLALEGGDARVAAGVDVHRLLARAEGVVQRQPRLARDELVVPLEDEEQGDGDAPRRLLERLRL